MPKDEPCPRCAGTGKVTRFQACPDCKGNGKVGSAKKSN